MRREARLSRRGFLVRSGAVGIGLAAAGWRLSPGRLWAEQGVADWSATIRKIADPEIRAGLEAAIVKNLIPPATEIYYPGHFNITANGRDFGGDSTWPGLDSWQMAGAYLLLGRTRMVCDYFDFVRASQRKDGNIPFAVFSEMRPNATYLRGLKYPDDVFTYKPPKRPGLPASSRQTRKWIGLFEHWQPHANPLSTLGPVCYVLTAGEIFDAIGSQPWLQERLASVEGAAKFLLGRKSGNGLISGSGFYTEVPPRYAWDGVTQCYVVHAFRELARLLRAAGNAAGAAAWSGHADRLEQAFIAAFWRQDHFGEYIHPERGLVDSHGLSDVNWAAVAFGIAAGGKLERLWPRLLKEPGFWLGDMPTQSVTKPFTYEKWEYPEPLPWQISPLNDVAAMGRVWHLEALACCRMKDHARLVESTRKVCRTGLKAGDYWRERYHPHPDGTVTADGAEKYCEYPANLVRTVLGNRETFLR
jgi:hypothetical protein